MNSPVSNLYERMRKFAVFSLAFACAGAQAQTWFTVMGSSGNANVDTVELNLQGLQPKAEVSFMEMRVNLAKTRTMSSGERYTSYVSHIAIACAEDAIVHVDQMRYEQSLWQGPSTHQKFEEVRPMAFGGLEPNPKARILKASCPSQ
jgi:hypothetical protein